MNDELNQLIRMVQVLRVRSGNLSRDILAKHPTAKEPSKKAAAVEDLAREAQTKLEQVRAYFD